MQRDLLPLFPLPTVLLPRDEMPLHIFEDRYKEMIGLVLADNSEFGVVLAARGGIASEGCTASVRDVVQRYEDGRMDIVTIGVRRFRVHAVDQELAYPRANVEFFDDDMEPTPTTQLREEAVRACEGIGEGGDTPEAHEPGLSFRLASRFTDVLFRQYLLGVRSEAERLRRIIAFVPEYRERGHQAERMRDLAPKNGHGKHPPGMPDE